MQIRKLRPVGAVLALAVAATAGAPAKAADDETAALYKQKCAVCHGMNGKGETPAGSATKVRSFSDPAVAKQSDQELEAVTAKGRKQMPAYGKSLKPDQIKALVAYIRALSK